MGMVNKRNKGLDLKYCISLLDAKLMPLRACLSFSKPINNNAHYNTLLYL